jgi:hypothetical protein
MPSSRRLLALLPLRSLYSCSFENDLSCTALCADLGGGSLADRAEGRPAVNGRVAPEFARYLASDSRRLMGGDPSGDLPSILSAFVREGGRWAGGGRGFEAK